MNKSFILNNVSEKDIEDIKVKFLGTPDTFNLSKHWTQQELEEHCISVIKKMTIDQQIEFLLAIGYID